MADIGRGIRGLLADVDRWLDAKSAEREEAENFAEALHTAWPQLRSAGLTHAPRRSSVTVRGQPLTLIAQPSSSATRVVIASQRFVEQVWLPAANAVAYAQNVGVAIAKMSAGTPSTEPERHSAPDRLTIERTASQTELPWNVKIRSLGSLTNDGFESRRRLLIAGFVLLLAMMLGASYFITRAVTREMAVARLQSDFVSAVSHEFRTPLTALRQFTDLLQRLDGPDPEGRRTCYEAQARATDRLARMVESILDFGQMEAGARQYAFADTDCSLLVQQVVDDYGAQPQASSYRIDCDRNGAAPVLADAEALSRALWNLLDNAVKYSPEARNIHVEVAQKDGLVSPSRRRPRTPAG